jgi:DegV family protein with EDD domain
MKVGIVSTSVSALPQDKIYEYNIKVVPLPFSLNGDRYLDGVDIPASRIYELLAYKLPFRTSSPPPDDYLAAFLEVSKRADEILCLTISKKLSMMYSSASNAAQELSRKMNVSVIDTGTAAGAQALIDLAVAKVAEKGAKLDECVRLVERMRNRVSLYGLIIEPEYLARTGRVPSLLPKAASIIGIKPIISISQGEAKVVKIARTSASGVNHILAMMRKKAGNKPVRVIVQHANAREEAEHMKEQVENEFLCSEIYLTEFSPVMGYATGPGTLILSFITDDK